MSRPPDTYALTTDRLGLRLMRVEDAESIFHGYASDPEAARYMTFATATNVAETVAFLLAQKRMFEDGHSILWAIHYQDDGRFVGAIEMTNMEDSEGEVGFIIARPYWGRGIVPEALAAVLAFSNERLGLRKVRGRCDVDNVRSARVFQKLGFRNLGVMPDAALHPNLSAQPRDARVFVYEF